MIISVVMMVADKHGVLVRVSNMLAQAVSPIHYIVNFPFAIVSKGKEVLASQEMLLNKNQALRAKQVLLQLQLQQLQTTELENKELKELFSSSQYVEADVDVAQLLAVNAGPNKNELLINKGESHSLFVGQAVLDASGVMGQLVSVSANTSRLMLLTDSRSAIPVENTHSGFRAIAAGDGMSGHLFLQHVPKTVDIAVGDLFVTSGLGQGFPQGYPVGTVVEVIKQPGRQFAQVVLKPKARLNQSRLMLLLWLSSGEQELL